jgi:hypothetical protein
VGFRDRTNGQSAMAIMPYTLMETSMRILNLSTALMTASLFIAAPALAQTASGQTGNPSYGSSTAANPGQKQRTQESGGPSMQQPCSQSYNANIASDPNCKQR